MNTTFWNSNENPGYPIVSPSQLVDQVVFVKNVRVIQTKYGERWAVDVQHDGEMKTMLFTRLPDSAREKLLYSIMDYVELKGELAARVVQKTTKNKRPFITLERP